MSELIVSAFGSARPPADRHRRGTVAVMASGVVPRVVDVPMGWRSADFKLVLGQQGVTCGDLCDGFGST